MSLKKFDYQIGVGGLALSDLEKQLVLDVLESNRLTYGPRSQQFEEQFASRHGCRHGLYMNSGTSALQVALAALKEQRGWSDGDEVIVPAVTFVASCNVILQNNLKPVFIDVEADTYNLDPSLLESVLTPRTRAIMPVHLLGLPAAMDRIMAFARRHNLAVVEASAECMFATHQGRSVGSLGDIGCFSTYAAHILVTGVGGLATTNCDELSMLMRSLMNHGRDLAYISCTDDAGLEGEALARVIARRFSFDRVGYSYRCTELEAALGLGQLARADELLARRKEIASIYTRELADLAEFIQLPTCPADRTHSFMVYGITTRGNERDRLVNYLENLNIETRSLLPLTNQPVYRKMFGEDLEDRYPVAKRINRQSFYIGCHPFMESREIDFVIEAFHNFYRRGLPRHLNVDAVKQTAAAPAKCAEATLAEPVLTANAPLPSVH